MRSVVLSGIFQRKSFYSHPDGATLFNPEMIFLDTDKAWLIFTVKFDFEGTSQTAGFALFLAGLTELSS